MFLLGIWTIYDHPTDFPDYFIARKWIIGGKIDEPQATDEILMDKDLDQLRAKLPVGLYCMPRNAMDDSVIIETWV